MNELAHIGNSDISVKMYNGQRVVTFKDIDMVHERPEGTARKRFADNKKHFVEGVDYYKISSSEIRTTKLFDIPDRATADYALITESGYLMLVKSFTDDLAWDVQRQLVDSYFRVGQVVSDELSPQMQLLMNMVNQMANKELADKERDRQIAKANEIANKAVETTEKIRDEIIKPFDNWRDDINKKVRQISHQANIPYQELFGQMYSELENEAGCNLSTRARNKRDRMELQGCRKAEIQKESTKIAVIEEDKKLKQIFEGIVRRYGMKYLA